MSRRTDRIASLLQTELGELILRKLKDPRVSLVTITRVNISADLKVALIYYSVLGGEKEKTGANRALKGAAGFLQHEIAEALKLRFTPKLNFHLDESVEEGMHIDRILYHLEKDDQAKKI